MKPETRLHFYVLIDFMQTKKHFFRKICTLSLILIFIFGLLFSQPASAAFTWNQTSYADFLGNTLTNIDITSVLGNATISAASNSIAEEWTNNGVDISDTSNRQQYPQVISDGAGNAIISWFDTASDRIYVQKIDSDGRLQWTSSGVAVSSRANPSNPQIVSDGAGGAIISWDEYQDATYTYNVYAQRINSSGSAQWTAGGVTISAETSHQRYNQIASDGSNGAVITWRDFRNSSWNIFAQRINSSGTVQWTTNGVAITTAGSAGSQQIIYSGSGSVIISWTYGGDIYAQKFNSSGAAQWTAGGEVICNATNYQDFSKLVTDGAGGSIISWEDDRVAETHMYAQKVDTDGAAQWTTNGVILSPSYDHSLSEITTDGLGGAIVTWHANTNIYAQRINSLGQIPSGGSWVANGLIVIDGAGDQSDPKIVSDNSNGAIIVWKDSNTSNYIYAQKINSNGEKFWSTNGEIISADLVSFPEYLSISVDGSGGAYVVWDDYYDNVQLYAQNIRNTPNYPTSGTNTMLSSIYDAGAGISATFDNITWNTNLPANTNITFETRSAPDNTPTIWRDDFNDGNVDNVISGNIAYPEFTGGVYLTWPPTEPGGVLTFINPQPVSELVTDDYYIQIDTGYAADYFPGGSTVTASITIITESPTAELYMFVDGWDIDSGYTSTTNSEIEISYTSALNEPFNTVGFDLYLLDHQIGDNDQFLINYLTIEPPVGAIEWEDWISPSGDTINSPDGRYIQYQATFSTTDSVVTPTLYDVTITDVDSGFDNSLEGNVNISANVDPSLTLNLSSTTCNLLTMSETDLKTCNYNITVNTNADIGYTASIRQEGDFQSGTNIIAPVSGGVGTVTAGTEGYGYATSDTTYSSSGYFIPAHPDAGDCDSFNNQHATSAPVKALANTDAPIAQADGPVAAEITTICHAVAISGSTPAGAYSQNITITVVGNF